MWDCSTTDLPTGWGSQPLCSWNTTTALMFLLPAAPTCPSIWHYNLLLSPTPALATSPGKCIAGITGPGQSPRPPSQLKWPLGLLPLLHLFFQRVNTVLSSTLGVFPLGSNSLYSALYFATLPQLNLAFLEDAPSINPGFVLSPCNNNL